MTSRRPRRERPRHRRRKSPRRRAAPRARGVAAREIIPTIRLHRAKGGTMLHRVGFAALTVSVVGLAVFALGPSTTVLTDTAHAQGVVAKGNLKYTGNASCGPSTSHGRT